MWQARKHDAGLAGVEKLQLFSDGQPVSYRDFLDGLAHEPTRLAWWVSQFNDCPFSVFRWETPPVSAMNLGRHFEWVYIDSPGLDRPASPDSFAKPLAETVPKGVAVFKNLGKDAVLVVPAPAAPGSDYVHLGAFIREAPLEQQEYFWRCVAEAMLAAVDGSPRWLNTAGAGVPWLHVRIDSRPKYYQYRPYCDWA